MMNTDLQKPDHGRSDFRRFNADSLKQEPQLTVQLTMEEKKAWQDCMKNLSAIGPTISSATIGYITFRAIRSHAQAKYAAVIGGIMGLLLSRLTSSEICVAKVAAMPQYTLKDRLERARYENIHTSNRQIFQSPDTASVTQSTKESSTEIVFDDYPPMNSYDTYSNFNDSSDVLISEDTDLSEPINVQKDTTYEELRHKNRDEYYKKTRQYYVPEMPEKYPTIEMIQQRQIPASTPMQEKTKYGDVWG